MQPQHSEKELRQLESDQERSGEVGRRRQRRADQHRHQERDRERLRDRRRSVTGAKNANGTVTGTHIGDGAITSPKIGDGAITGSKIADGAVGSADLDPNTVGDIISTAGTFPNDGVSREVLKVPGFGKLTASCSGADTVGLFYGLEVGVKQTPASGANDPFDEEPKGAAAITSEKGGGVGFSGSKSILVEAEVFAFTDDRVLAIDLPVTPGCVYRIRATLDHNET